MKKAVLHYFLPGILLLLGGFLAAQEPAISNLSLTASSPGNLTDDQLICTYTTSPSVVETTTAWYQNYSPIMMLYMPFEAGAANALLDYSGYHHDATTSAVPDQVPTWNAAGGYNGSGAFSFDGNDYLLISNGIRQHSSYSKTAWINIATTASAFRNIISSTLNDLNNHHFKVNPNGRLNAGHSFGDVIVMDPDSMNHDQWYFVAVTFNYESGEMILYRDGVEVDREIVPVALRNVYDETVQIGAKGFTFNWDGIIDDPRVYTRALSAEQIQTLYTSGNNLLEPQETVASDIWYTIVTPFSSSQVGSQVISNQITIQGPTISGLSLSASSPGNLTIDDLTATYTTNSSVVETASAWYRNGTPENLLFLPFEGGATNARLDFSGSDNHVTRSLFQDSVPSWNSTGGHNGSGAFTFNGNDYLLADDAFPLNSSYTKTAWINVTGSAFNNIISSIRFDDNNHCFKVDPNGTLHAGHSFGSSIVGDPAPMNMGQWYFVAVSFDYVTGEMILYKNGSEVDRATVALALRSVVDPSVLIGAMDFGFGFNGTIDEPRIYGHVLTPEQISSLYSNGNDVVASEETFGSDEWHVEVTPFSVYGVGNTYTSNTVTIHSVVVSDIPNQTILEGSTFNTFDLDAYVVDYEYPDSDLDWTVSGNSDLVVAVDPVTHVVTVTIPSINWYGSEDITFTATSPNTDSDETEVTFTVQNLNDAPVLTEIGGQSTNEDTNLTGLSVVYTDVDPMDVHTITIISSHPSVTVANLSGNTSGSTYNLVPAANWNGNAQITITVTDNGTGSLSDFETYTFVVNPINDAPVLTEIGNQSTDEDIDLARSVVFTDPDAADLHTITVVSAEPNVTVTNLSGNTSGSTYELVPAANWHGSAQITVAVTDNGTGTLSDLENYTLTVHSLNDAPVLTEIGAQGCEEGEALTGLSVIFTDVDPSDTHTITVVSDDPNVTVVNLSGNTSGSNYDLVPAAEWNGDAQITVMVTDNGAGSLSDTEIYTFSVNSVNDAPVMSIVGDQSADEDNTLQVSVVFSDLDAVDEHSITVHSSEANVSIANLTGHVSGSTYDLVPAANWNGSAQITVTVTDNGDGALFDSETYTLTVNPVNDAPSSIRLSSYVVDENVAIGTVVGIITSDDPDSDDVHLYELISDGTMLSGGIDAFVIDGDSLKTAVELNFEEQEIYWILMESDDQNGGTIGEYFTVNVQDLLETGVREIGNDLSMKVYPVPANDMITVEVDNPENKNLLLEIFSDVGQLVHSERTIIGNTIYVNEFPDGMYILRISGENVFETRKFVVKDR